MQKHRAKTMWGDTEQNATKVASSHQPIAKKIRIKLFCASNFTIAGSARCLLQKMQKIMSINMQVFNLQKTNRNVFHNWDHVKGVDAIGRSLKLHRKLANRSNYKSSNSFNESSLFWKRYACNSRLLLLTVGVPDLRIAWFVWQNSTPLPVRCPGWPCMVFFVSVCGSQITVRWKGSERS